MKERWLTTNDNPFDPFTQFYKWLRFDEVKGYRTCERIASLVHYSSGLTDLEVDQSIDQAIDTLVQIYAPLDLYRPITPVTSRRWGL